MWVLFCSAKAWAGVQSHLPVFPVRRDHRLRSHQEQTCSVTFYQRATALHVTAHFTKVPTTQPHSSLWVPALELFCLLLCLNLCFSCKCNDVFYELLAWVSVWVIFDPLLTVSCLIRLRVWAVSRNAHFLVLTSPVNDHILKSHCHVRTSDCVFPEADSGL